MEDLDYITWKLFHEYVYLFVVLFFVVAIVIMERLKKKKEDAKLKDYVNIVCDEQSVGERIELKYGGTVAFTGDVHGSVGIRFDLEYDTTFFDVVKEKNYNHPEEVEQGMRGADRAKLTYKLKPKRKGETKVRWIKGFRRTAEKEVEYIISVR